MEAFITKYYNAIFGILIVLIIAVSFYLGTLQGAQNGAKSGLTLACSDQVLSSLKIPLKAIASGSIAKEQLSLGTKTGNFLGSKNGTKYYTPNCSGVSRINPENIIWFTSEEDARLQGYSPAKC